MLLDTKIKFHFEIYPGLITQQDLELLSSAPRDRFQFEIGIQSVNPDSLKSIHRNTNWHMIKSTIQKIIELKNIHVHVDLITGLPYEDIESMKNSFNSVYNLRADHFQLGFLKVLPGTELAGKINEFGIKHMSGPPYEVLSTKWMNFTEIDGFRRLAKLLDSLYNSCHFTTTLSELIDLHKSPYDFYNDLYRFISTGSEFEITKNWKKNGKYLSQYISENYQKNEDFLYDCLRWDWCRFATAHYYPEYLRNNVLREAKEIGRKRFIENYSDQFSIYEINKAIYFAASSMDFQKKYLRNNRIGMFFKQKKGNSIFIQLN